MKNLFGAIICFLTSIYSAEPWKFELTTALNATLNSYTNNWVGGETGSFSWALQMSGIAEKQFTQKLNLKNTLKLAFGQTSTQDEEARSWIDRWSPMVKSTDLIDFESVLKFTLGGWVDPFIAARLVSQFYDIRDTALIRYVNPLDITESFGIIRLLVKKERVSLDARLGGAVRQLIDRDKLDADGIGRATDVTNDGGLELVGNFKATHRKEILVYQSTLRIYEALFSSLNEEGGDTDWRYPDVNWENTLGINITKVLMVNIYVQMLYDREIDVDPRLKETLAVGLSYTFKRPKEEKKEDPAVVK